MEVSPAGFAAVQQRVAELRGGVAAVSAPSSFAAQLAAARTARAAAANAAALTSAGAGTAPGLPAGSPAAISPTALGDWWATAPAALRRVTTAPGGTGPLAGGAGAAPGAPAPAVAAPAASTDPAAEIARLRSFGNGRIPRSELAEIGVGSHRMAAPAAEAARRLLAAAKADGVRIGVTDSYRDYDAQVDVARRKGLYSQGGLAARPGTSDHGWGLSLDLDLNSRALTWMRTHAASFGFREDVPREPWHWTFKP